MRRSATTAFVIAALLLGIELGAVLGYFALRPSAESRPEGSFLLPVEKASETHLVLGSLTRTLQPTDFLVRFSMDTVHGVTAISGNMSTRGSAKIFGAGGSYGIFWKDSGTSGSLDAGDAFIVTYLRDGPCRSDPAVLSLLWHDQSEIASMQFRWNCTSRVGVTLGTASSRLNGTFVPITSITDAALPIHFQVRLHVGGQVAEPVWLDEPGSILLPGYSSSFGVSHADTDLSGSVTRGDEIGLALPVDLRPGTSLSIDLLWRDGTELATANWTR